MDELFEETGYEGPVRFEPLAKFQTSDGSFCYHNFLAIVEDEFEAWHSQDGGNVRWLEFGDWPAPLHFGVQHLLSDDESVDCIADFVARAKEGEDLLAGCQPAERTLYHCLYKTPEGHSIQPTCLRDENGRQDRFLYATPYLSKALAFSFSYHNGKDICMNGPIEGTPQEFAIVCRREETLTAPRPAHVYGFSSDGFEAIPGARQYISTAPVPFNRATLLFETNDINDVMSNGVQIFSVNETPAEFFKPRGLNDHYGSGLSNEEMLFRLVRDGHAKWENRERGIGVCQELLDAFEQMEDRRAHTSLLSFATPG